MYGKSILSNKTAPHAACQIIESAAVLNLQHQHQQQQQNKDKEASMGVMSTPSKSSSSILPNGDMPFKVGRPASCVCVCV